MQAHASPTFSTLLQEVQRFWTPLPDKPEETPEGVLAALWSTACGTPLSVDRAVNATLPALDEASQARLRELIERRRNGVPLAHLTERQTFLGLEFLAGPDALIPRKETEILGRAALAKIGCMAKKRGPLMVIDVCTGSGNLALAYAYYGLAGRVEARIGDLLEPFEEPTYLGKCDFLSCNPPYISAAKVKEMHPEISRHEPEAAFNGGAYGVTILMKLLKNAPRFLRPGGWLGFEVGHGQGPGLARQLQRNPAFAGVETYSDAAGEIRAILAKSKPVLG
jgi:release factor glutamine methyltransferase